jgi:hypothetical protein
VGLPLVGFRRRRVNERGSRAAALRKSLFPAGEK